MYIKAKTTSKQGRRRRVMLVVGVVAFLGLSSAAATAAFYQPPCGGGYPQKWCTRALDSVVDNWGMYNRECVSYTAYRVAASGRHMPYGFGDANNWPAAARKHGIPVDSSPRAGDVAVRLNKKFGHSMYVESVNSDGTINISQYNVNGSGGFSQDTISASGLQFIHF